MIARFLKGFINCFKIPDLRKRILFTLGIIAVYRIGCYIPTPGINGGAISEYFRRVSETTGGSVFNMMNMFSGGALEKLTLFSLGVMPYISSSIIMQLLTAVVPALEKLSKEGHAGQQKINQYTRYGTLVLGLVQAWFIALWLENPQSFMGLQIVNNPGWGFRIMTALTLTAGVIFLMWLGEQIQEKGIGNGVSLIIACGILSAAPSAMNTLYMQLTHKAQGVAQIQPMTVLMMVFLLIGVIMAVTLISQAQRRVPVQYARRMVGTKTYGGQSTFIPIKVDTSGVIAIIFAQSIILFPATIAVFIPIPFIQKFAGVITRGASMYYLIYGALIIFFCYFYTMIVFNSEEIAKNLQRHGGFVPGVRPGAQTAEYLDSILMRVTLIGALYICTIAVMPDAIMASFKVPYLVASFFGGTGVLIIVGVVLDFMKQIESHLQMHHYEGFMKTGHIRGRR